MSPSTGATLGCHPWVLPLGATHHNYHKVGSCHNRLCEGCDGWRPWAEPHANFGDMRAGINPAPTVLIVGKFIPSLLVS